MFTKLASWLTVVMVAFAGFAEAALVDLTNNVTQFQTGLTVTTSKVSPARPLSGSRITTAASS